MVILVDSVSINPVLYNQAVGMIYSLPRSGCDAWRNLGTSHIWTAQDSEKASNRKYVLKVAQTTIFSYTRMTPKRRW